MNKKQIKQYYQRFRRWQQAEPHFANLHADSVQHCHCCGTRFDGNFCPLCGQRAGLGRVGWQSVKENIALLWGMDSRSLLYSLLQLLTRPGYLVRDYISGHRQVSFPPVKMLVVVSLFALIIETVFHLKKEDILPFHLGIPVIDKIVQWFNDNKSWGLLFTSSISILPTWVVFRFAPAYPRHTLPEGFFLQVFLSIQGLLFGFLGYMSGDLDTTLNIIFTLITYHQLFGYGWIATLWRCAVVFVASLMMFLPFVFLSFLLGKPEGVGDKNLDKALLIGGCLLAVMFLLTSIVLYITYRISSKRYHQEPSRTKVYPVT